MSSFRCGKHVVFAARYIDRQRKQKTCGRVSEHVFFFTTSNAPFFVTVNGVRYAQLTHGQRCQPILGPMHLYQWICQPSKYISTQKRKRSKAVKLHDGTPWRTLLCSDTICAHENNITATLAWCHPRIQMISGQEIDEQATEADKAQKQNQKCARAESASQIKHVRRTVPPRLPWPK